MIGFFDLFDGKVGNVLFMDEDSGLENGMNMESPVVYDYGDDEIYVNDVLHSVGAEVSDIDSFLTEEDIPSLWLFLTGGGYRGEGCYNGAVERDGKWYFLDIVSEGMVYELLPNE